MNEPVPFVEGTFGLTEIPRHRPEPTEQGCSVFESPGDEMDDLALALHLARHPHEPRPEHDVALALEEATPDDDVELAGLVLRKGSAAASASDRGASTGRAGRDPGHPEPVQGAAMIFKVPP